jgi:hypothetical protein
LIHASFDLQLLHFRSWSRFDSALSSSHCPLTPTTNTPPSYSVTAQNIISLNLKKFAIIFALALILFFHFLRSLVSLDHTERNKKAISSRAWGDAKWCLDPRPARNTNNALINSAPSSRITLRICLS